MTTYSVANDMTESARPPDDVTGDACKLEFIEIVPPSTDTARCDHGHYWSDVVKQEHLPVVKQEPVDVCYVRLY